MILQDCLGSLPDEMFSLHIDARLVHIELISINYHKKAAPLVSLISKILIFND